MYISPLKWAAASEFIRDVLFALGKPEPEPCATVNLRTIAFEVVGQIEELKLTAQQTALDAVLAHIREEVLRAERKHAPMNSAHEGYAVILEELDELWEEVRKQTAARQVGQLEIESVQTAAMAVRFVLNVCWKLRAYSPAPPEAGRG